MYVSPRRLHIVSEWKIDVSNKFSLESPRSRVISVSRQVPKKQKVAWWCWEEMSFVIKLVAVNLDEKCNNVCKSN